MLSSLTSLLQLLAQNHESVRSIVTHNEHYNHWHIPLHVSLRAKAFLAQIHEFKINYNTPNNQPVGIYSNEQIPLESLATCLLCLEANLRVQLRFQNESPLANWLFTEWLKLSPQLAEYITLSSSSLTHCQRIIVPAASPLKQLPGRSVFQMPNTRAIAQLTGNETDEELMLLCSDIFTYFGRYELNVGLLLVPNDYNFVPLLRQAEAFNYLRQINIYANHYEYQQFTLLLNLKQHLDNGVILLRSDNQTVPKIGVLHHTPISSLDSLPPHSQVYSNKGLLPHTQAFGSLATTACWRNPQLLAFLK